MVTEPQADMQPGDGAGGDDALFAQYEQEYRDQLQTPDAPPEVPSQGEPTTPTPAASSTEPAPGAEAAPVEPPVETETPQQRERRFQAEADRVLNLFQQGRGHELTATELAKAREIARHVAQLQPDVVAPLTRQEYERGRQEAEQWAQIDAYARNITAIDTAFQQGDATIEEANQQFRQLGFQNYGEAMGWLSQARQAQQAQQQRANQPDPTPFLEQGFNQGVVTAGDAFMAAFRTLDEFKGMTDTEWVSKVDQARQSGSFPAVIAMIRDALKETWDKQARTVTTQAAQQAREQATTELLQTIPPPDISQGGVGGDAYRTYNDLAMAYAEGRISSTAFLRHPLRKAFEGG